VLFDIRLRRRHHCYEENWPIDIEALRPLEEALSSLSMPYLLDTLVRVSNQFWCYTAWTSPAPSRARKLAGEATSTCTPLSSTYMGQLLPEETQDVCLLLRPKESDTEWFIQSDQIDNDVNPTEVDDLDAIPPPSVPRRIQCLGILNSYLTSI